MRRCVLTLSCIAVIWFLLINAWWYVSLSLLEPSEGSRSDSSQSRVHDKPTSIFGLSFGKVVKPELKGAVKGYSLCPKRSLLDKFNIFKVKKPGKKYYLTIGIPTVLRHSAFYLSSTLDSVISNMSAEERMQVLIVIFIADFDERTKRETSIRLIKSHRNFIRSGLIRVIHAPKWFYPTLETTKKHINESQSHVMWRSKQAADFAYLMCYSQNLSEYYLHLEDDINAAPVFVQRLKDFIKEQKSEWALLDTTGLGVMGKVFHSKHLLKLANFFLLFHNEQPADHLQYLWERTMVDTQHTKKIRHSALFQHAGVHSSFDYNISDNLKQRHFDNYTQKYLGVNPRAAVMSNLEAYKGQAKDCYVKGAGFFWTKGNISQPSTIDVTFYSTFTPKQVAVETGSLYTPHDLLQHGELRVGFYKGWFSRFCDDMQAVAIFRDGRVDINLTFLTQPIKCLQIVVTKPQREWIFFRSVDIWELTR